MARRPAHVTVTYRVPASLDDEAVEGRGAHLRAVAADPRVERLTLDCRLLRSVSPRGLGLLAAIRLILSGRGAHLEAFGGTIDMTAKLRLVGIRAVPLEPPVEHTGLPTDADEQDWTPWWTSASANA